MGRAGDVSYGSQCVQATRWTDETPQLRHCAWFVRQPSQKFLSFGNSVITRGGFSLPSKVLIQHNKVHFKYAGMIYRQWHLFGRHHVKVWLNVGSRLWLAIYLFLFFIICSHLSVPYKSWWFPLEPNFTLWGEVEAEEMKTVEVGA